VLRTFFFVFYPTRPALSLSGLPSLDKASNTVPTTAAVRTLECIHWSLEALFFSTTCARAIFSRVPMVDPTRLTCPLGFHISEPCFVLPQSGQSCCIPGRHPQLLRCSITNSDRCIFSQAANWCHFLAISLRSNMSCSPRIQLISTPGNANTTPLLVSSNTVRHLYVNLHSVLLSSM